MAELQRISFVPRFDVDEETRLALVELGLVYLSELPLLLNDLRELIASAASDRLAVLKARNLVHKMRGTAGSMGFPEVSELARRLEAKLTFEEGEPPASCESLLVLNSDIESIERLAKFLLCGEAPLDSLAESLLNPVVDLVMVGPRTFLAVDLERILADHLVGGRGTRFHSVYNEGELAGRLPDLMADLLVVDASENLGILLEVGRILGKLRINLPVLAVIKECSLEIRNELYEAGASDFICEPFCQAEVIARVERCLSAPEPV